MSAGVICTTILVAGVATALHLLWDARTHRIVRRGGRYFPERRYLDDWRPIDRHGHMIRPEQAVGYAYRSHALDVVRLSRRLTRRRAGHR